MKPALPFLVCGLVLGACPAEKKPEKPRVACILINSGGTWLQLVDNDSECTREARSTDVLWIRAMPTVKTTTGLTFPKEAPMRWLNADAPKEGVPASGTLAFALGQERLDGRRTRGTASWDFAFGQQRTQGTGPAIIVNGGE